jgi:exosortase/archaeosortase family protein
VDGTTIWVGDQPLQVEKACSGLGMLLVFFALSSAVALLMKRPLLDKLVVLLSAIPIALLANVTRITATGLLYEVTNDPRVRTFIHDGAGWFMMIFALVVMLIELKLLSWLFVETDPAEQMPIGLHARALLPRANPGRAAPA